MTRTTHCSEKPGVSQESGRFQSEGVFKGRERNEGWFYSGESGEAYFSSHFTEQVAFGRKIQSRYFTPYCSPDVRLLDFGCGDGTILRALPAKAKTGVEVNPICRQRIESLNSGEPVPISVCEHIQEVPAAGVDVAISNHCLEHVHNPLSTLKEVYRVLAPGGKLVTVTPFDDWRRPVHRSWSPTDLDRHLFTWSPRNLGNLMSEAGFQVLNTRVCTFKWSPKIFWLHHYFGQKVFLLACSALGWAKNAREIFVLAQRS